MNSPQSLRQKAAVFAAPILVVAIGYALVFQRPLARELSQHLAKQHKLEEVARRSKAEMAESGQRLSALQVEERRLALELEDAKKTGARLVTQRSDRRAELFRTTSPASLVSQALEVLARHELECLDSSPIVAPAASADSLEALKPVADLLGATGDQDSCRRQVRIKLVGRFQDMQAAVRDMQAALPDIFTVSLEMEAADGRTDRRVWILTISV